MSEVRAQRRLAAILAADIVGYSRLIEADEAGTLAAIRSLRSELIDAQIAAHNGRIVKLMGDGAIVEFGSVVDAVGCAVEIQKVVPVRQGDVPAARRIILRIGINLGDVVVEGDDLLGDGVNIAARLEQLCPPGGVLISGTAYDHMKGKLDLPIDFAGEQQVKNISEPVRTYNVRMAGVKHIWRWRTRRFRRLLPMAAAATVLLLIGAVGTWWLQPDDSTIGKPSIAVLPFDNLGRDEATGRLADGITEDIITDLARFSDFDVMARNSTAVYAGKPVDVRQVGKDLNVRYVLEGSVQHQGDEIRITAQLIDAETGAHIWTERWDRPDADVFALQTEIVEQAANRIGVAGVIVEAQHKSAQSKRPENLNAYEKYLLAKDRVSRPSKERLDEAIVLFKQALEEDPTLARAWRDLAWAYDMSTWYEADYATAHPLAIEAARRAVALDPMDAGAHAALGVQIAYDGDFVRGKAALDTALRLNPGHADILALAASWSSTFGDPERGAALADKAIRINPNFGAPISTNFYTAYFMAGRYEDALHIIDRLPEENRTRYSRAIGASSYAALGQPDMAKTAVKEALEHHPELTAEGFANEPGFNDTERKKFAKLMIAAGFPTCEPMDKLARVAKPFRLPECSATPTP